MKKTININFQGQLITIEETAYHLLNQYIESLKGYFGREAEGNEIVNDIENRIAELFGNRLKHGISCITDDDVTSIIETIGRVEDFDSDFAILGEETEVPPALPKGEERATPPPVEEQERRKLYRKANDKILGGVCSGLAHYLRVDPVFVRLAFVLLSSLFFWVYIIMWIVVPKKVLPNNVSKRLYRDPNNRFIGGVASGIAAYFRIDVWIPRLIFLLPIMFNVFGLTRYSFSFSGYSMINLSFVTVYIILWIIVPKAVTVKQKLEMMGEEEYLRTIRERVSNMAQTTRSSRADAADASVGDVANVVAGDTPPPPPPPYTGAPHTPYTMEGPQRSGCLTLLIGLLKVTFFGIVGLVAAGFMISLFALIFTGTKLIPLQSLFLNAGMEQTLLWVSI
ncbi:MAG TPA: PspC domain-containing protein, partial [Bacteroidales bacterium]|nr:PspC domain-containing protein [Bacteroidales bacterium]